MRHPLTADTFFLYRFDEPASSDNAVDAGPNGYTLAQTGSPTVVPGVFGNGRQFASGKYFSRYDAVSIITYGHSQATLCGWFNWDGTLPGVGRSQMVLYINSGPTYVAMHFVAIGHDGKLTVQIYGEGSNCSLTTPNAITAGLHHFCLTYRSGTPHRYYLYLDGNLVTSYTTVDLQNVKVKGSGAYTDSTLTIGKASDSGYDRFTGWVDDIAWYWTEQSAAWVAMMNDATPPTIGSQSPANGATGVLLDVPIVFDVTDAGAGVDAAATTAVVGGLTVWSASAALEGWTGVVTAISGGYRWTLTPPADWSRDSRVAVDVSAADLALNVATSSWTFRTGGAPGLLQALEDAFEDMLHQRWLDSARGGLLDMLGAIVGVRRSTALVLDQAFDKAPVAAGLPARNVDVGASALALLPTQHEEATLFRAFAAALVTSVINESSVNLAAADDETYRNAIRLQIVFNTSHGAPETLIAIAKTVLAADHIRFLRKAPATVVLWAHKIASWGQAAQIKNAAAGGTQVVVTGEPTGSPFVFGSDEDTSGVEHGPGPDIGAGLGELTLTGGGYISEVYA